MKEQIEELLNLGLDLDKFYCVTLFYDIKLQGYATASTMDYLSKLGYEFNFDNQNNWFECRKNNVVITLTLNN